MSLAKLERFQLRQGAEVKFFPILVSSTWVKRLRVEPEVGVKSWEPKGSAAFGEDVTAEEGKHDKFG